MSDIKNPTGYRDQRPAGRPNFRGGGPPRGQQFYGGEQKDRDFEEVIGAIKQLKGMQDLEPKLFANKDGYAARIANTRTMRQNLNTSQLRKFFEPLAKMRADLKKGAEWDDVEAQLYMVIPRLAYSVGRTLAPKEFYDLVVACVEKVQSGANAEEKTRNFMSFMDFLEAIVAYSKYFEVKTWG